MEGAGGKLAGASRVAGQAPWRANLMVAVETSRESAILKWTQRGFHALLVTVLLLVIGIRVYSFFATSASAGHRGQATRTLQDWWKLGDRATKEEHWERAISAYTVITEREPGNLQAWYRLALSLQSAHHWDRAIAAHLRVSQFERATSWAMYNIACIYAQKGEKRIAMDYLREAVEAGFRRSQPISSDPDLISLLNEPEFRELEELAKPIRLRSVYHRYDFLVGHWRLQGSEGRRAGRFDVRHGTDRYALFGELQDDLRSVTYSIMAFYDPGAHVWKQVWVDNYGTVLQLHSTESDEETLALIGEMLTADGQDESVRVKYETMEGGMIHHTLSRSRDAGATWETLLDATLIPFKPENKKGLGGTRKPGKSRSKRAP